MGFEATNSGPRASDFFRFGGFLWFPDTPAVAAFLVQGTDHTSFKECSIRAFLKTKPVWLEGLRGLRSGLRASGFQVWDRP